MCDKEKAGSRIERRALELGGGVGKRSDMKGNDLSPASFLSVVVYRQVCSGICLCVVSRKALEFQELQGRQGKARTKQRRIARKRSFCPHMLPPSLTLSTWVGFFPL